MHIPSQERRSQYTEWIEQSVLRPLRIGNPDIFKNLVRFIINVIPTYENDPELFGHILLDQLPESMLQLVINENEELANKCGFTNQRIFDIGEHRKVLADDLFAAAKEVLKSNVEQKYSRFERKSYSD